jgi:hypothetical protein
MLYSASHHIAFAHYPKTGGGSISRWFLETFPDAVEISPAHCHIPVRKALAVATGGASLPLWRRVIHGRRMARLRGAPVFDVRRARDLRVLGVVREPFDMLVSLFRWWRRPEHHSSSHHPLRNAAERGDFRGFVHHAVVARRLPRYEDFFDVGGLAWPRTRLVHFEGLQSGLTAVTREFGVPAPVHMGWHNRAVREDTTHASYAQEAAALMPAIRRYSAWYEANERTFVRGETPAVPRTHAA